MKIYVGFLGVCVLLASQGAYTEIIPNGTTVTNPNYGRNTINGPANLKEMGYISLTVNGPTVLDHLTVTQDFQVNGPLSGAHLLCRDLKVTGPVNLTHVTVKGPMTIHGGPVSIFQGTLQNVTIAAKVIKLSNTTVGSIVIQKVDEEKQQLILEGAEVKGTVFFESGKGELIIDAASKIAGSIQGLAPKTTTPAAPEKHS